MYLGVRPLHDYSSDHWGVMARGTSPRFETIEGSLRWAQDQDCPPARRLGNKIKTYRLVVRFLVIMFFAWHVSVEKAGFCTNTTWCLISWALCLGRSRPAHLARTPCMFLFLLALFFPSSLSSSPFLFWFLLSPSLSVSPPPTGLPLFPLSPPLLCLPLLSFSLLLLSHSSLLSSIPPSHSSVLSSSAPALLASSSPPVHSLLLSSSPRLLSFTLLLRSSACAISPSSFSFSRPFLTSSWPPLILTTLPLLPLLLLLLSCYLPLLLPTLRTWSVSYFASVISDAYFFWALQTQFPWFPTGRRQLGSFEWSTSWARPAGQPARAHAHMTWRSVFDLNG